MVLGLSHPKVMVWGLSHPKGIIKTKHVQLKSRISCQWFLQNDIVNVTVRPIKLRCVLNKVFLVNHWHDILNCSYKWLCLSNSYRCIGCKTINVNTNILHNTCGLT